MCSFGAKQKMAEDLVTTSEPFSVEKDLLDPMEAFSCFPQIRETILDALPSKDLLVSREVCRNWRREARIALSKRRHHAHVNGCCEEIVKFMECMKLSKFCAINGVEIKKPKEYACSKWVTGSFLEQLCASLKQLNIRSLTLEVTPCYLSGMLMRQLALQASHSVQELFITYPSDDGIINDADLFRKPIPSFPALKVLSVQHSCLVPIETLEVARKAPNLQKIVGLFRLDDVSNVEPRLIRLLTGLTCQPVTGVNNTLATVVEANPHLTVLEFFDYEDNAFGPAWCNHLQSLLKSSATTLAKLSVCATKFYEAVDAIGLILEKLESLELYFPFSANSDEFWTIIMALRLHTCCPSLQTVRIDFKGYCSHEIDTAVFLEPEVGVPVTSVTEIKLAEPPCTVIFIENCIDIFPEFSSFAFQWLSCMDVCDTLSTDHAYDLHVVWSILPSLERLKVCIMSEGNSPTGVTLDALFCGITEDEREVLKTYAEGHIIDLRNYLLCPTRPSLTYAKSLKELCLVYAPYEVLNAFTVSAVSGHLVFARMPSLHVKVISYGSNAAARSAHLKPFAEVICFPQRLDLW